MVAEVRGKHHRWHRHEDYGRVNDRVPLNGLGKACPMMTMTMAAHAVLLGRSAGIVPILVSRRRYGRRLIDSNQGCRITRSQFGSALRSIHRSREHHCDQHEQDDEWVQDKAAIA